MAKIFQDSLMILWHRMMPIVVVSVIFGCEKKSTSSIEAEAIVASEPDVDSSVQGPEEIRAMVLNLEAIADKKKILEIIRNSKLPEATRVSVRQYVENFDFNPVDNAGLFIDNFLSPLIEILPNGSLESVKVISDIAKVGIDALKPIQVSDLLKARSEFLVTVFEEAIVRKEISEEDAKEGLTYAVESSGYWQEADVESVSDVLFDQLLANSAVQQRLAKDPGNAESRSAAMDMEGSNDDLGSPQQDKVEVPVSDTSQTGDNLDDPDPLVQPVPGPDITAPTLTGSGSPRLDSTTARKASISWDPMEDDRSDSEALTYRVYSSLTNNLLDVVSTLENGSLVDGTIESHSTSLSGLIPGTEYFINIVVSDEAGNESAYDSFSFSTADAFHFYDAHQESGSSSPKNFVEFDGKLFFNAYTADDGSDLWFYDGTSSPLKVPAPDPDSEFDPEHLMVLGDTLYMKGTTSAAGAELFSYDGSTLQLVTDLNSGNQSGYINGGMVFQGSLYFQGNDGSTGFELYKYNPTDGLSQVADIRAGSGSSSALPMGIVNNKLIFSARTLAEGYELWEYDGTNAPTLVQDIRPGVNSSSPRYATVFAGDLYFIANDGSNGTELWSYDGATSPAMVANLAPGTSSSSPDHLTVHAGKLYFVAADATAIRQLFVYDGVGSPTLFDDISTGSGGLSISTMASNGTYLYMSASRAETGFEVFITDGTSAPVPVDYLEGSASSFPEDFYVFQNNLYYSASRPGTGYELHTMNESNEIAYFDINSKTLNSDVSRPVQLGANIYFYSETDEYGSEIYRLDISTESSDTITLVQDTYPGAAGNPRTQPLIWQDKLYFIGKTTNFGKLRLWEYDGLNSPIELDDGNGSSDTYSVSVLTRTDELLVFKDRLYFAASTSNSGSELWAYDGENPPSMVADINPGSAGSFPEFMTEFQDKLYFYANNGTDGGELWSYDGVNPPVMVEDIYPGGFFSNPRYLKVFQDKLYFTAQDAANGRELRSYDGTGSVVLAADIRAGSGGADPEFLTVFQDKLIFSADDGVHGAELWQYDGINPPTMVGDLNSGGAHFYPKNFSVIDNLLYFSGEQAGFGAELFTWDGATPPEKIKELYSGSNSGAPTHFTKIGDFIYFVGFTPEFGRELIRYEPPTAD